MQVVYVDCVNYVCMCNVCVSWLFLQHMNRLTLSIVSDGSEERQQHCTCTTDWLASVLLTKLARWSQESHLNIETLSLRLVDIESYSVTYERLKQKYGPYLVSVSDLLICM